VGLHIKKVKTDRPFKCCSMTTVVDRSPPGEGTRTGRIGPHEGGGDRAQQGRGECAIPQGGLTRRSDPTDEATPGSQIYLSFLHALYESYVYSSACLSQACIYAVVGKVTVTPLQSYRTSYFLK
jgi:hypothetical protein